VSKAAPAQRGPRALKVVEDFLTKHHVRCQRINVRNTFRGIMFGRKQQKDRKERPSEPSPAAEAGAQSVNAVEDLPPWDQYLATNGHFTSHGQFMHTVAWEVNGRHVLTVVPHPTRVDLDKVARAVQAEKSAVKQRKLKDLGKDTTFPVFVCPPFGHPQDSQGRDPILLVDSMVTELKKPLLFDCGTVGLSVPVSEFLRSTGAACVEGLGKAPASRGSHITGGGRRELH